MGPNDEDARSLEASENEVSSFVVEAIKGFVRSIILGHENALAHVLQRHAAFDNFVVQLR